MAADRRSETSSSKWARHRDIPLTILAWIAVVAVILWCAGHIVRSLILLAIAALLAYALAPAVKPLERVMPRTLAILIVYLIFFGVLSTLLYMVFGNAIRESLSFFRLARDVLKPGQPAQLSPVEQTLLSLGITPDQLAALHEQIMARAENYAASALPILRSVFNFVLDTILTAVVSIYLLFDGPRAVNWISRNAPVPARADFILNTVQRVVGGYIRGQVLLAALIGLLVGVGMYCFQLPYAFFLGVLAFAMAFVPVLGTFISGALCVLIGLTHGWLIALGVLIYFIIIHIIEGDLVGPRIVGKAIGLHPVVSILALVAGAELFGVWGALFASPVVGLLQALLVEFWREWRKGHPEQFKKMVEQKS